MAARFVIRHCHVVPAHEFVGHDAEPIDLVVTLGGDGTILHASSLFKVGAVPPVLSFSMGTLGFLLPFRASSIHFILRRTLNAYMNELQISMITNEQLTARLKAK